MGRARPDRIGPIDYVESLGLQTFGKERTDPSYVVRKPIFTYKPVLALYKVELQALSGRLIRDQVQGTLLDRSSTNLFSGELDEMLANYGPLIWPEPGRGSRHHLREPQEGTRYPRDLIYPGDSAILKELLRGIVLCKKVRSGVDLESYINKTHKNVKKLNFLFENNVPADLPLGSKRRSTDMTDDETVLHRTGSEESEMHISSDESEDSGSDTKTPSQTSNWSSVSAGLPFKIELRLCRSKKQAIPIAPGSTWSYGNLMFTDRIKSCEDLFALICDEIEADCSFMIFHLPEDMSMEDPVRIDRGSKECEMVFRCIRGILQRARRFPCGPLHRSVELEIGLGID